MNIEEKNGNFVITDFNEFDACRIACKIEKDGIDFYAKLIRKVDIPPVRESLKFLTKEENEHLKVFQGLLDELRTQKEDLSEDNDILTTMDFGVFQPYEDIEDLGGALTDINKAIRLGIAIEKKTIIFYQACKDKVTSAIARDALSKIIDQEQHHKDILERILYAL